MAQEADGALAPGLFMRIATALIVGALAWSLGAPGGVVAARAGLAPNDRAVAHGMDDQPGRLLEARERPARREAIGPSAHRLYDQFARLGKVRERLARGEAWHRSIRRQAGELEREIEELDQQRDGAATALARQRQQIEALERALDHAVPRLLARLRELRDSREIVAQAVAGLAALSRNVELDGTAKARLLAISPVILERLGAAEARVNALRKRSEALVAQHRQARSRASAMLTELERAQRQRRDKQQARARALARLPAIQVELAALKAEQQTLARRVLETENAHAARGGPQPDRPALDGSSHEIVRRAGPAGHAVIKAMLADESHLARRVDGARRAMAHLVAMATHPVLDPAAIDLASRAASHSLASAAKPVAATLRGDLQPALPDATRWAAQLADPSAAALPALFSTGPMAHVEPSRLEPASAPIVLIPGRVLARLGEVAGDRDGPGITIPAAHGQAVAAPEDGRIVFAGAFRSYGLLLIIAHEREYHTLLWGFSGLEVQVGDRVRTGQVVGVMGRQGKLSPKLHVELRRNGRPVNPLPWLAANTSKVRG
jgi:septal ring factor EnvC (AmiA/AmiB activator)